jgi:hypothetical protein
LMLLIMASALVISIAFVFLLGGTRRGAHPTPSSGPAPDLLAT